ncbi:MAG: hypothetical protein FWC10_03920 [Lentimicrobiaceae bacterium]|nr:hypothetical protein [Lentimicrobiaceae bacterium]
MAKGVLQHQKQISKKGDITTVAQTEQMLVDDSLLPTAEELSKLKELDPDIMSWMKERCVIEQNARIDFNKNQMMLAKKDVGWFHFNNLMSMLLVFFVAITGLGLSCFLIVNNYKLEGSIFGLTGLAVMIYSMRKSPNNKNGK